MSSNIAKTTPNSHRFDDGRVWYLLLGIGVPVRCGDADPARHLRVIRKELRALDGIVIRQLDVVLGNNALGHYLFRFQNYKRDDYAATKLAEAFLYAISSVHGPTLEPHHDSLTLRVPQTLLRGARSMNEDDLVSLEESRAAEERDLDFPSTAIGSLSLTTPDVHEAAWRIASVTFKNNALFDATRYLKRSFDNFYVFPGQIQEVVSEKDTLARNSSHQTHFEDALQNAFKAIEAVIGDPPRDDGKFFDKLKRIGLDPQEPVGYTEKQAISGVIRKMNMARDKRSAHGSTPDRAIRPAELLEFQTCAEVIVLAALEKARGSPPFG